MKLNNCLAAIVTIVSTGLMPANATEEPPCTTTITEFPKFSNLHTTTIYETTITQISELDCSGCVLTVTKRHFGHGPVESITATEYEYASTTTNFACEETGEKEL